MAESVSRTSLNVLVVDDEPNIRKMLALSLSTDGHRVTAVTNPAMPSPRQRGSRLTRRLWISGLGRRGGWT